MTDIADKVAKVRAFREGIPQPGPLSLTRDDLLATALWVRDREALAELCHAASSGTERIAAVQLHLWALNGAQSVIMPDTYAAALMATDALGALELAHMPWPTFEIRVPPGVLYSSTGELTSIFVSELPSWVVMSTWYHDTSE